MNNSKQIIHVTVQLVFLSFASVIGHHILVLLFMVKLEKSSCTS